MKPPTLSPTIIITVVPSSHVSTKTSASYSPSQMSLLSSLFLLPWFPSPAHSVSWRSLLASIRPYQNYVKESLCGCSLRCQHGGGVHSEGWRGPLPQHGTMLQQLEPHSFCKCGQGLLKYLNDSDNLCLYIAFTVGNSKLAQTGVYE